ncbi:hypothetical protein [Sphingomonas sp. T9W2]|uniref:hypothetical protein n=1 Tax=Sphingomonas sp. T9W2 TaxID=3143183 RepID=UPI0031F4F18A
MRPATGRSAETPRSFNPSFVHPVELCCVTFAAIDPASGDGIVVLSNGGNGWLVILPILERPVSNSKLITFLRGQMN